MRLRHFLISTLFIIGMLSASTPGQSGRVTGIVVDPSDPSGNTYYVSSANGGVWKTTDGGTSFVLVQLAAGVAYLFATR